MGHCRSEMVIGLMVIIVYVYITGFFAFRNPTLVKYTVRPNSLAPSCCRRGWFSATHHHSRQVCGARNARTVYRNAIGPPRVYSKRHLVGRSVGRSTAAHLIADTYRDENATRVDCRRKSSETPTDSCL